MADFLRKQFPTVDLYSYHVQPNSVKAEIFPHLSDSDLIISQILPAHGMEEFSKEALQNIAKKVIIIPPLVFSGFHPDMIIVPYRGAPLNSPIEVYHSRIIAAAYTLGLSSVQAGNVVNTLLFTRLGYFRQFDAAREVFFEMLRPYDLEDFARSKWDNWIAQKAFMHTPNHPNIAMLKDFALHAVESIGLVPDAPIQGEIEDIFDAQHGCPVYPELARRLGVKGESTFRKYRRAADNEAERYMNIHQFAKSSYQIYQSLNRDEILLDSSVRFARRVIQDLISGAEL